MDGFCKCCARVVRTWRKPQIAKVFQMEFSAPIFTTPEVEHHHRVTALKDCANIQKCSLCKLIYSAIIYSAKKEQSQMRLPEDGTTSTYAGYYFDANKQSASSFEASGLDLTQLQKGEFVWSTSPGDIDAIQDDQIQLQMGEITLSLTSGNAGAGENPSLQIRVGRSHRSHLTIYPVKGMTIVHLKVVF
jgi:hypothetical protein